MQQILSIISGLLPACGLEIRECEHAEFLDCTVSATSMRILFGVGPGPSVVATCVLPAPPVPDEALAAVTARFQAWVPHARLQLRRAPGGATVAFFDDAHAFDPAGPPLTAAWLRGSVQALELAARAVGIFGEKLNGTEGLISTYSADDARRHTALKAILQAHEFSFVEEARVLGGPAVVINDEVRMRIMVRGGTLLFHVASPFDAPYDVRAGFAAAVHSRLPFGRVLIGPPDAKAIVVEYPHRVGADLTEFDVLHGFSAMTVLSEAMSNLAGGA